MLSLVIKNAILIILIILIVHFLLKGMLDERKAPSVIQPQTSPAPSGSLGASAPKTELTAEPMPLSMPLSSSLLENMSNPNPNPNSTKDDLFSYIYGGKDVSAPASLEEREKDTENEKGKIHESPSPVGDEKEAPKDAGTSHHMIIREYTNEKPLNGGNLFNGLSAFDAEFAPYASL